MARTQSPSAYDRSVKARAQRRTPGEVLTNSERSLRAGDEATINALDAVEAGHADATKLIVGALCTISIGSDSYAAKIVRVSASLKTIDAQYTHGGGLDGEVKTFRLTKYGYTCRKHWHLSVGDATTHIDMDR